MTRGFTKPWITVDSRIKAVKEYLSGTSPQRVADDMGVHYTTIYNWARKYYKRARNGITIAPHLRKRYSVKLTKHGMPRGAMSDNAIYVADNKSKVTKKPFIDSMEKVETTTKPLVAGLTDIKIAGNFTLVDGKAYATDIVVALGDRTSFTLTKDTLKLLNDLGSKLL